MKVLVEGASQDSWRESHVVVVEAPVPPTCSTIVVDGINLSLLGVLAPDGNIAIRNSLPSEELPSRINGVLSASSFEITSPRFAVVADGRVYGDRFLLGELNGGTAVFDPSAAADLGTNILSRLQCASALAQYLPALNQ